jgi:hypothetical protein
MELPFPEEGATPAPDNEPARVFGSPVILVGGPAAQLPSACSVVPLGHSPAPDGEPLRDDEPLPDGDEFDGGGGGSFGCIVPDEPPLDFDDDPSLDGPQLPSDWRTVPFGQDCCSDFGGIERFVVLGAVVLLCGNDVEPCPFGLVPCSEGCDVLGVVLVGGGGSFDVPWLDPGDGAVGWIVFSEVDGAVLGWFEPEPLVPLVPWAGGWDVLGVVLCGGGGSLADAPPLVEDDGGLSCVVLAAPFLPDDGCLAGGQLPFDWAPLMQFCCWFPDVEGCC